MAFSWEPSEFDRTFVVNGTLTVITSNGKRVLGYPKPVSVSAQNQRDAKAKVKTMLLSRSGLNETHVAEDLLEVTAKS